MRHLKLGLVTAACAAMPMLGSGQTVTLNIGAERSVQIADNRRNPGEMAPIALGDLDGDGFEDLIAGAPRAAGFTTVEAGMVYVRFGASYYDDLAPAFDDQGMYFDFTAPPSAVANPVYSSVTLADALGRVPSGIQIIPERGGEAFGSALASGDFNGDGFADVAIAATAPFNNQLGAVYVLMGRADIGGRVEIESEIFNGRAIEIKGRENGSRFGERLLFADIDNDGFDDLVISTPRSGAGGLIDVLYGDTNVFSFARRNINTIPIDRTNIISNVAGERLGTSVAAGDLNNDGFAELALGAPLWPSSAQGNGRVVVVNLGSSRTPAVDMFITPPYFQMQSTIAQYGLGQAVAIGDLNADLREDLIVSAPFAEQNGLANAGVVYHVSNPSTFAGTTALLPADAATTIRGGQVGEFFGWSLATGPYDIPLGPELIVGAPGYARGPLVNAGAVYIYRSATLPAGTIDRFDSMYPITKLEVAKANFELGRNVALGNFDGQHELDIFCSGSGALNFGVNCGTGIQSDYDACHAAREGLHVYGVLARTMSSPSTGLTARKGWMLAE